MKSPLKLVACIFICLVLFLISSIIYEKISDRIDYVKALENTNKYYETNFLIKKGGTTFFATYGDSLVKYNLRSFDAGKHWYTVEDNDSSLIIIGPVEKTLPGLIQYLQLVDSLTKCIDKK